MKKANTNLAPVALFTFCKLKPLQHTLKHLANNYLALETELFIFSDGPRNPKDAQKIKEVRAFIAQVNGFKKVHVLNATENKGLANSIIEGVSMLCKSHGKVIVLEDDLVTAPNFLDYMNSALTQFINESNVLSIGGYTPQLKASTVNQYPFDNYYTKRATSWGWATWKDRWEQVDWKVSTYNSFKNDKLQRKNFNKMGSDLDGMLAKQMNGEIDSWAIRWCFHQFLQDTYTVFPTVSKIANIGFTEEATHTGAKGMDTRFKTTLDKGEKRNFRWATEVKLLPTFIKDFKKPYTLVTRIKYKLIGLFG